MHCVEAAVLCNSIITSVITFREILSIKTIVISAINIYSSGPLTIVRDFLSTLVASKVFLRGELRVILFCHSADLYKDLSSKNILLIAKPLSRKNWLVRLFYEYIWFWLWSVNYDVDYWISLHDVTPNVKAKHRILYCHNSSLFYSGVHKWREAPGFEMFRLFYKYLYRINLGKNEYIIVQQQWIRDAFVSRLGCDPLRLIVARPDVRLIHKEEVQQKKSPSSMTSIIYPAFPRLFKNYEVLLDAMRQLADAPIKLILTLTGKENNYARRVADECNNLKNVELVGFLTYEELFKVYSDVDAMVFPSKLETWGLPLSEFRCFNKPIFAANLPYAKETLSGYDQVCYFDPDDFKELCRLLSRFIMYREFKPTRFDTVYAPPFAQGWDELLKLIGLI